jgi:hypothetical protein
MSRRRVDDDEIRLSPARPHSGGRQVPRCTRFVPRSAARRLIAVVKLGSPLRGASAILSMDYVETSDAHLNT